VQNPRVIPAGFEPRRDPDHSARTGQYDGAMDSSQAIPNAAPAAPASQPPVAFARRAVVWMPVVACIILAVLGLYPGSVFTSCVTPLMLGGLGILGAIVWIRAVIVSKTGWWWAVLLAAAVVVTGEAANYYVIAKAAFPLFQPALEERARKLHPGERVQNERIGIYYLDEIAADERGGVYFRVSKGGFMLSIDSRGFAWRPNSDGSPFGDTRYGLNYIDYDWAIFFAETGD
jgi:hypothetical protein